MDDVKVYSAESALRKPGRLLRDMWRDIVMSRGLAWRLAVRDISALYRQSILGILWAFILPLANAVTWLFLRNSGIVSVHETPVPYPVYVFTGTMLWSIVTESLLTPMTKMQSSKSLLTKINFPRESLILSGIYQTLFNAAIRILLIGVGLVVLGYYPADWTAALFPIGVLSLVLAGTAIGLLLTPIGMLYTDIGKGLTVAMQFLMYATPVVFPIPKGNDLVARIISHNPLTPLIMTTRDWLTGSDALFVNEFYYMSLAFLAIFLVAWLFFRITMPFLVERMSS